MNIETAHNEAIIAAQAATESIALQYGKESEGNYDACGFAWVKTDVDGRSGRRSTTQKVGFQKRLELRIYSVESFWLRWTEHARKGGPALGAYAHVMTEALGTEFFAQSRMD